MLRCTQLRKELSAAFLEEPEWCCPEFSQRVFKKSGAGKVKKCCVWIAALVPSCSALLSEATAVLFNGAE